MRAVDLDDRTRALLAPVAPLIAYGVENLPEVPALRIRVGSCAGICALEGTELILSEGLEGPATHHPDEPTSSLPPLDRWRRAAGCVLEAVATVGFAAHVHREPREDWRWRGAAIHIVDTIAPDLNLAGPDIALAVSTGDLGAHPRAHRRQRRVRELDLAHAADGAAHALMRGRGSAS